MSDPADTQRLVGDMIRIGVIASVDFSNPADPLVTVTIGDLTTSPLPIIMHRAGRVVVWSPPSVGEQCVVLSPEGDTEAGLVLLGLFSKANPAPSTSPDLVMIQFEDGAQLAYDMAAHALTVTLPDGGTAVIDAPGGMPINADLTVKGKMTLQGDLDHDGEITTKDVTAQGGIKLTAHGHGEVSAGAAKSGKAIAL